MPHSLRNARTRSAEIRASRAFGRDYSVAFAASWRKTTHGINSSYLNRVFSTALVRQL